jgi:ABC-type uncharacterized transport system substrate-binding protein
MSRQQPFIGMFMNLSEDDSEISARREAFLQGVGAIPGLTVAACFGAGDFGNYGEKAQALHDLVVDGAGPDLYFCTCWPSLRALMGVAGDTPIVFAGVADLSSAPAGNLEYGSNVYGFISYGNNLCAEWSRLLRAVAPNVARAAVLYDMSPQRPSTQLIFNEIVAQAGKLNPNLDVTRGIDCASATLDADLASFVNEAGTPAGLIVAVSVVTAKKRQPIVKLANSLKLPVVYPNRLYTFNGGLASMGTYIQGLYRSAGVYAQKLIKGHQPSPRINITQTGLDPDPNKRAVFETVINIKAAATIGLTVDPAVLMKADLLIN